MNTGNGIINADGDLWKVQRKAGLNFLSNANLKVLTDVALPQYLDDTIQELQKKDPTTVVDLEEVLHELTTQIMGRMAYNVCRYDPLKFQIRVLTASRWTSIILIHSPSPSTTLQEQLARGSKIHFGKSQRYFLAKNSVIQLRE